MVAAMTPQGVYEITTNGALRLNLHAGQQRAYWSDKRFILILAGTQSGKTSIGPAWLFREMQRRGPGDYLIGSPTFPLMEIKVLPEFKRFFRGMLQLGEYVGSPLRKFTLNRRGNQMLFGTPDPGEETHVYFGYGNDPDSLESATYKAAWLDEAGQKKFRLASWEAILRRLAIAMGRVLITTTPYTLGWLKTELHDKASDPSEDIELVNFPSIANPMFRREEWERAKRSLPAWKFNMFYRGIFDRPAGLIYDCFDRATHTIPRFTIPTEWERFLGLDFGGVHTAGLFFAKELGADGTPSGRYIGYREYLEGGRTSAQHAAALLAGEPRQPTAVGGSWSEGQWRSEFSAGGLGVSKPPISDVEVGITRFYGALKEMIFVFFDDLLGTLDQLESYSRPLDEQGNPMEGIEDKNMYHYLDAGRYIGTHLIDGLDGQLVFEVRIMDVLRTIFLDDPRAARAYVTGPADVDPSRMYWGFDSEEYQPAAYATYPATSNGVYACINARTRALSSLPLRIYSGKPDADGRRKEVTSGPARDLLDRVNPFWTFERWLDMTEQSLCVWGESFTFYAKQGNKPVELWWARADQVKVHPHPTEYISHFTYDTGSGNPIRFERDETLWLRFPNVNNQWEGLSPLAAARLAADTSSAAMKSNFNIFQNGLTGAGMVSPKEGQSLSQDQAKAVSDDLNRRFKGVANAHKVAVLRFGVDIKQLSLTPKDAEFLGMMNLSLEDIARAYAVPIDKIGGKRTYQNVDDSEKVFWSDCVLPEARFIAAEITEQLLPLFGGNMVAEFDDSDINVLHEAETAKWERWQGQITTGARTVNEYRAEEGLDAVPWGDVWWMQNTMVPIDSDEKPVAATPPALAGNADPDDDPDEPPAERRRTRVIEYGSPDHVARMQRADAAAEPWERRIGNECARLMRDQQQSVLAQLRQRSRSAEQLALSPFDESRWIKAFRIAMRPVIEDVVQEASELAQDELGFGVAFDVQDPNVIRAIEKQVQTFAEQVNNTTWTELRDELAEGLANGEGIDQLAERVENVMRDRIRSSKETIARTETTKASTTGTIETGRQSGVAVSKEWVAALDGRTRETHREAHGQTVGLDDVFTVGAATGSGPGNMSSAKESANCRCAVVLVLDVQEDQ